MHTCAHTHAHTHTCVHSSQPPGSPSSLPTGRSSGCRVLISQSRFLNPGQRPPGQELAEAQAPHGAASMMPPDPGPGRAAPTLRLRHLRARACALSTYVPGWTAPPQGTALPHHLPLDAAAQSLVLLECMNKRRGREAPRSALSRGCPSAVQPVLCSPRVAGRTAVWCRLDGPRVSHIALQGRGEGRWARGQRGGPHWPQGGHGTESTIYTGRARSLSPAASRDEVLSFLPSQQ